MNAVGCWERYKKHLCVVEEIGLRVDISRMNFDEDTFFEDMAEPMAEALAAMTALEGGAIANPDENRMVGHYWLRTPELAPNDDIGQEIEVAIRSVKQFAQRVHSGDVKPQQAEGFYVVLIVGIGGSGLGPQLLADALGEPDDPIIVRYLDNTDPNGIRRVLDELGASIAETLTVVISKSGGTKETRNGMMEAADAYRRAGLDFARHVVAVTGSGSDLDKKAADEGWLARFPLWDWVGGRTSILSPVGLLPAALQGLDVDALLAGATACDVATRNPKVKKNPAALLALMWHYAGDGRGARDMVVLPYRDRLALFGKYLQQLVMESLGKERDRDGQIVRQGLTVYGNKGSTDQHAYVQQLREGLDRFFATFIEVRHGGGDDSIQVELDVTSGDYLHGFLFGTRSALFENQRESITISLDHLDARGLGVLIALFERAVGLYAELINVNAYHQPGVEAGKKAAGIVLDLQHLAIKHLRAHPGQSFTADALAEAVDQPAMVESLFHLLEHLVANDDHGVSCQSGDAVWSTTFCCS